MTTAQLAQIRRTARYVAEHSPNVTVLREGLRPLAEQFEPATFDGARADLDLEGITPREHRLAYVVTLGALRFGSGYSSKLAKRPGLSGRETLVACLQDRFREHGPFTATEMVRVSPDAMAALLGQDRRDPVQEEYVELTTRALRDLGRLVQERFGGSLVALVESASASAARLVDVLATAPYFHDVQRYRGIEAPFLHRAQRLVVDLHAAFGDDGLGRFTDLADLAPSSDAVIAQALRSENVLRFESHLSDHVERGELVLAHSEREIEIRAATVHAVDLLVATLAERGTRATPLCVDSWLRDRVRKRRPRALPRHRTRTVRY